MKSQAYVWKAIDTEGQVRRGVWVGEEFALIRSRLREHGFYPLFIRPQRFTWFKVFFERTERNCWGNFSRRLAMLLDAGIPILKGLEIVSQYDMKGRQQQKWRKVRESVESGCDLSEALLTISPPPPLFVQSMIKAGEQAGTLALTLHNVAVELEQQDHFRQKIKTALTYPTLLILATIGVLGVLGTWILPMYQRLFAGLDADLPSLTKVIFYGGQQLPKFLSLLTLISLSGFVILWIKFPHTWATELKNLAVNLPVVGKLLQLSDLVQFSRILGGLLMAGIPLLEALNLTESSVRTKKVQTQVHQLIISVRQGQHMSTALKTNKSFPATAREMIGVAEETGQLDKMLHHIARMYQQELEGYLARIARLLEPTLILGAAVLIGIVAVGVLLPIFDASTHLQ